MGQSGYRSVLHHVTVAACLTCVVLQLASGFFITRETAHHPHSTRAKRDVGYNTLCKANPRNCDPRALTIKRPRTRAAFLPSGVQGLTHQESQSEADLYRILQKSLSLFVDLKPSHKTMCQSYPRTCKDAKKSSTVGKRADLDRAVIQLHEITRAQLGAMNAGSAEESMFPGGELTPSSYSDEFLQRFLANYKYWNQHNKLPAAVEGWSVDSDKGATGKVDFYEPW